MTFKLSQPQEVIGVADHRGNFAEGTIYTRNGDVFRFRFQDFQLRIYLDDDPEDDNDVYLNYFFGRSTIDLKFLMVTTQKIFIWTDDVKICEYEKKKLSKREGKFPKIEPTKSRNGGVICDEYWKKLARLSKSSIICAELGRKLNEWITSIDSNDPDIIEMKRKVENILETTGDELFDEYTHYFPQKLRNTIDRNYIEWTRILDDYVVLQEILS
jgi:hypothetical protein